MLPGLNPLELGRLRLSVGYGTHKKGRPLSPVEVADHLSRATAAGSSLDACAHEVRIDESGVGRFLRLLDLPEDVRHLVDWGSGKGVVGFSCATEIVRIEDPGDQRKVAQAVLEHGLKSREVRQVAQLLKRSGESASDAVDEVLGMRPVVVKRYVYLGSVIDEGLSTALEGKTQQERDRLLASVLGELGLDSASGRLGASRFTLVGDENLGRMLTGPEGDELEERLCRRLSVEIGGGASG